MPCTLMDVKQMHYWLKQTLQHRFRGAAPVARQAE